MKYFFLLLITGLMFSCGKSENAKEIEDLNKKLMAGHDEVMPKSMKIDDVRKALADFDKKAPDSTKTKIASVSKDLQKAEDDMYVWMEKFGVAMNDEKDNVKKLAAYKDLETQINDIKKRTDDGLNAAEVILKSK